MPYNSSIKYFPLGRINTQFDEDVENAFGLFFL